MSVERTFSMIKPDAVAAGQAGEILAMIQAAGFRVVNLRMIRITESQAQGFYAVHAGITLPNDASVALHEPSQVSRTLLKQPHLDCGKPALAARRIAGRAASRGTSRAASSRATRCSGMCS